MTLSRTHPELVPLARVQHALITDLRFVMIASMVLAISAGTGAQEDDLTPVLAQFE